MPKRLADIEHVVKNAGWRLEAGGWRKRGWRGRRKAEMSRIFR
jgi:hypothetical protein